MADAYVTLNEAAELEGTTYARVSGYDSCSRSHFTSTD